jgi:hypothetical protein
MAGFVPMAGILAILAEMFCYSFVLIFQLFQIHNVG